MLSKKIELIPRSKIEDSRGFFLKVITGRESDLPNYTGEVYLTMAKPHETKGGHYHLLANEWFILISGKCLMKLKDVETQETLEFNLDAENPQTFFIPKKVAHTFINISDTREFLLLAYSDQLYKPDDTIVYEL